MRYPHEYVRAGTATQLTRFHPASGEVRVKGVQRGTNAVLHPWLTAELAAILARLPEPTERLSPEEHRRRWERWQAGLPGRITLPEDLPPLRRLLIRDNLTGHSTVAFVLWRFAHGIMPRDTPLGGSWLNRAASSQRLLTRRAVEGPHPQTPAAIIAWLAAAAGGWNQEPTPCIWGGKRQARRERARHRRHRVGGSEAYTRQPRRRSRAACRNGYEQSN